MDVIERKSNLSHQVTQELGRAIVRGEYSSENTLPTEAELCLKFGVSRTAVREAVKMLSAKGLVSSKPRQGIRVMPEEDWNILDSDLLSWSLQGKPSRAVLKEFFQLRVAVEPEAAALAALHSTPALRQAIADAIDRMRHSPANSELAIAADVDFHIALLYATGNRFYIRLRDFVRTALNVSIHFTTPGTGGYEDTVDAHARILRAIEQGDVDHARSSTRALIDDALILIEAGAGAVS